MDEESPIPIPRVRCEGRGDHGPHVFRGEKSKASLVIPGLSIPGMPDHWLSADAVVGDAVWK